MHKHGSQLHIIQVENLVRVCDITWVTCNDSSHLVTQVNMRSSQSQVRVISQVTRAKSSHLGEISSQVKSSKKIATRVQVSDLTYYNTENHKWCVCGRPGIKRVSSYFKFQGCCNTTKRLERRGNRAPPPPMIFAMISERPTISPHSFVTFFFEVSHILWEHY